MSAPVQTVDLAGLPQPEVGAAPRRRLGLVILLFAAGALAVLALCVWGLLSEMSRPEAEVREGLASLGFMVVGGYALVIAVALLASGIATLRSRSVVRTAAWLEDPADRGLVRWWDGRQWTSYTSPRDPAVVALPPLASSSRRRHLWGWGLLVAGVALYLVCDRLTRALTAPPTVTYTPAGDPVITSGSIPLLPLVANATSVFALVAVVGLFLALTLSRDPAAGWAPDPLDPGRTRWWDGRSWTDLTSAADGRPPVVGQDGAASP